MQKLAQKRANDLAEGKKGDDVEWSKANNVGENISSFSDESMDQCEVSVRRWYDEMKKYNYDDPKYCTETGHFTALVWKASTELGCARTYSTKTKMVYVSCLFREPPNMEGEFRENVRLPKSTKKP